MLFAVLLWLLFGSWCVCQAIAWLPLRLAEDEAVAIYEVLAHQASTPSTSSSSPLKTPLVSFLLKRPAANWFNVYYVSFAALIGVWAYLSNASSWLFFLWTIFGWGLLILAAVDARTKLLPDMLTLPLLWIGLLIQLWPETRSVGLEYSLLGVVAGYVPLWLLAQAYRLLRGRDGLGMGDMKLLAAMGAWSGPWVLPHVLLLAAVLAIAVFALERFVCRSAAGIHEERPFGPAIVAAYFIVLFFTT